MSLGGSIRLVSCLLFTLAATVMAARAEDFNDYPTAARSEYVYGCLKANGETRQVIGQCSCSIDVIAPLSADRGPRDSGGAVRTQRLT